MNRQLLFALALTVSAFATAQVSVPREADIQIDPTGEGYHFVPITPPLEQVAGAPAAFYQYYWEFGDGYYSFQKEPGHTYSLDKEYEVQLWATGSYDNGVPPKSRKKKVAGKKKTLVADLGTTLLDGPEELLRLKAIRSPRANEELVIVMSYASPGTGQAGGRLHFYFNEKKWNQSHFLWMESRTHYGEQSLNVGDALSALPATVDFWAGDGDIDQSIELPGLVSMEMKTLAEETKTIFKNQHSWMVGQMHPNEQRNLFISLQGTAQMLADTNGIITVQAIWEPDGGTPVSYTLEMEIVASHDPNKIAVSDHRLNYRRIQKEGLKYKVRFQNNGEGPAKKIEVTATLPEKMIDKGVMLDKWYPDCPVCPKGNPLQGSCLDTVIQKGAIVFTFYNIYLPGSKQDGIADYDSTKGFVQFRMRPSKRMEKKAFDARASIVFDKNEPVVTNQTGTRFKTGLSPGIKVSYPFLPESLLKPAQQPAVDFILAPYRAHRWYWQMEAGYEGVIKDKITSSSAVDTFSINVILQQTVDVTRRYLADSIVQSSFKSTSNYQFFRVVPVQVRVNLSGWLGIGAGVSATISKISGEESINTRIDVVNRLDQTKVLGQAPREIKLAPKAIIVDGEVVSFNKWDLDIQPFLDLHIGRVRSWPVIGSRWYLTSGYAEVYLMARF